MSKIIPFTCGVTAALICVAAMYAVAPESMMPPRYRCAVKSADGCIAWTDPVRVERYRNAKAGS